MFVVVGKRKEKNGRQPQLKYHLLVFVTLLKEAKRKEKGKEKGKRKQIFPLERKRERTIFRRCPNVFYCFLLHSFPFCMLALTILEFFHPNTDHIGSHLRIEKTNVFPSS